jgi:Protein of unknown function (DUF3761)
MRRGVRFLLAGLVVVGIMAVPAVAEQRNATLTPGATNAAVTQATIASTVCRSGYTKTVRNVSNATKSRVYAEYAIAQTQKRLYVIDHLIPLEDGGANDITNLWPQLKADAKKKDVLENLVHSKLCSGALTLAAAQSAFLVDFSALPAPAPVTEAPAPATEPPATDPPATEAPVAPGGGATAQCNDGTFSYAAHHQGACSSHGGVATFYK